MGIPSLPETRLRALAAATLVALALVLARMAYLQGLQGPRLAWEAFRHRAELLPLELPRGDILDRRGRPLHAPVLRYRVVAYRPAVGDPRAAALRLAPLLGADPDRLLRLLQARDGPPLVVLADGVPPSRARAVAREGGPGIAAVAYRQRYGPGALAPLVVGRADPRSGRGLSGLELAYDGWLRGLLSPAAAAQLSLSPRLAGADVVTALDAQVQQAAERVLARWGVPGAVAVLELPQGDLRALAGRAVAAYPAGALVPLLEALAGEGGAPARSARWTDAARKAGWGVRAGTELPEEEPGYLPGAVEAQAGAVPRVTPVQAVRLAAAVALEGRLPGVRLVLEVRRADGLLLKAVPPPAPKAVFPPDAARRLKEEWRRCVAGGGCASAEVPGYGAAAFGARAGGVLWFLGYTPAYAPRYALALVLEGEDRLFRAAELFRAVAQEALLAR